MIPEKGCRWGLNTKVTDTMMSVSFPATHQFIISPSELMCY